MGRLGAIVLAAGGSIRLGRPKQLVMFRGMTLLEGAVATVREAGCEQIVVVLGRDAEPCKILLPTDVTTLVNPAWQTGMGSSIRVGVSALASDVDRSVIMLCDQPLVKAETLRRLIDKLEQTSADACVSDYKNTSGPPVVVGQSVLQSLRFWPDAEGAKRLWTDPTLNTQHVGAPEAAVDIDTESDLTQILNAR